MNSSEHAVCHAACTHVLLNSSHSFNHRLTSVIWAGCIASLMQSCHQLQSHLLIKVCQYVFELAEVKASGDHCSAELWPSCHTVADRLAWLRSVLQRMLRRNPLAALAMSQTALPRSSLAGDHQPHQVLARFVTCAQHSMMCSCTQLHGPPVAGRLRITLC